MARGTTWTLAFVTLVAGMLLGVVFAVVVAGPAAPGAVDDPGTVDTRADQQPLETNETGVQQFGSEQAFYEYVQAGQQHRTVQTRTQATGARRQTGGDGAAVEDDAATVEREQAAEPTAADGGVDGGTTDDGSPSRIAGSNVQVESLDEPDVVKTDGRNFYYAPTWTRMPRPEPIPEPTVEREQVTESTVRPERPEPQTYVVDASEPASPGRIGDIDAHGKLLQTGDTLVVFEESKNRIVGINVSSPDNPEQVWERPLEDRLVTARETGGQLYVVTETRVSIGTDCPIAPLGDAAAIDCGGVYAPNQQASVDSTYTAFSIDAASGDIEDSVSFVGSGDGTVVYMSPDALYVTYTTGVSETDMLAAFVEDSDAVPEQVERRINEIQSYDISERSARQEIERAIDEWLASLPAEKRQETQSELFDEFESYLGDRQEQLTRTGIVRVSVSDGDLAVEQTGEVPGEPLNQFALDEHNGTLRVTTTLPRVGDAESSNNLYVLDAETLDREDAVTGMGEDQRVYAVRYVGDTAYVVTFRQVDPFYVIDFSEPTDPELLGKLKLPGFSSYLHPLDDDGVIGIGEEDRRVKATLYDVDNPTDPVVGDEIKLDERFSAIEESHHAFLIDRRHEVFFLPAQNRGLVVDYSNGTLDVVADVEATGPVERARYVDDTLYVFASGELIALDQTDWERTATLDLRE